MAEDKFTYNPDEADRVLPDGTYSASIMSVQTKTSRTGKPMLEVCLEVFDGTKKMTLWDRIVRPEGIWKLAQLAGAFDAIKEFKEGQFELKNYTDRSLDITIVIKDDPDFGKQNRVTKYMPSKKPADREVPF